MDFMNAKDKAALRDRLLDARERIDQALGILNRGGDAPSPRQDGRDPIPDGPWKGDPATEKQIATLQKANVELWDGITKGEASKLIEDLFKRRAKK